MHKPELLAPAGDENSLHAAVCAGADAVYLGLENFNARRNAGNFTLETFAQAADYAHLRGVKVYVALNTVVLPGEERSALECARQAWRAGADAFIVQDIGLASEISRVMSYARLHASTQMNIHNAAGIRAASRLGARRVTLARELSLPEVANLVQEAAAYDMEVETFVHGALCVCYSGQCLMSSLIGGRSANRGLCAQACRLPYELVNAAQRKPLASPGDHLLSPQDLCAIDLLPNLIRAGVASFKIEGRMKSADYVFAVTSTYRSALDRAFAALSEGSDSAGEVGSAARDEYDENAGFGGSADFSDADGSVDFIRPAASAGVSAAAASCTAATSKEKRTLEEAFSRGFTTAYLEGKRANDIMSYKRPNNRGAFAGRVSSVDGNVAHVAGECRFAKGDVLEFWTGKGHVAQTLGDFTVDSKGHVCAPLDAKAAKSVRAGDRVFRVRSAQAAFDADPLEPRIPLCGSATLKLGQPLRVEFWPANQDSQDGQANSEGSHCVPSGLPTGRRALSGVAVGDVVEPARTKAVCKADVLAHIDRFGSVPYALVSLEIELDEGVGIGFSQLHHVRAQAIENLTQQLLAPYASRTLQKAVPAHRSPAARMSGSCVAAWVTNPACARAAKRAHADITYVPTLNSGKGNAVCAGQLSESAERETYPKHCIAAVPTVEHDSVSPAREGITGFDSWRDVSDAGVFADSIGAVERAIEKGIPFEIGPHVPITNAFSLQAAANLGAKRVWLSPELTLSQIKELSHDAPVVIGLTIIGTQELMVTEHCLLMSQGSCNQNCKVCPRRKSAHYLRDRKGFKFPVITDVTGRSHLYNSVQLDVAQALPELLAAGISSFMVDTTLMNAEETAAAVSRAKRALAVAQNDGNALAKMPDTTTGHLFRGVQ